MKRYDFVKIVNMKPEYKEKHLDLAKSGEIIEVVGDKAKLLLFNEFNRGDFAIAWVDVNDLVVTQSEHSAGYLELAKETHEYVLKREKDHTSLCPIPFESVDYVEVTVDKPEYLKYGIKKGTQGYIVDKHAVDFEIEVDFSGAEGVHSLEDNMWMTGISIWDLKKVEY